MKNIMFYRFNNFKQRIPFPFVDIYLFHWNELKKSGIHNHARNGCYIFLLRGKIKENIYNHNLTRINTNIYRYILCAGAVGATANFRTVPHH